MVIIVSKSSGFCNGVNYTITKTLEMLKQNNEKIYALGELVHNSLVLDNLKNNGLIIVEDLNKVPNNTKVIFRAHGETVENYELANSKKLDVIDLTCGKVMLIHNKIRKHNDCFILIIGKKSHPEVIGHISYANHGFIIEDESDIDKSFIEYQKSNLSKVYIVVQTTFNTNKFNYLVNKIKDKYLDILIDNTICNATEIRQKEVIELSSKVNKMIIIGGKNSSNTKELYVLACNNCPNVYLIENVMELDKIDFNKNDIVGISAGASTPKELIDSVYNYLNKIFE